MKKTLPRVLYCGMEDSLYKKLLRHASDFLLEAKTPSFRLTPQRFAKSKKAAVLLLKITDDFDLTHQEWLSRSDGSVPIIVFCKNGTVQTAIHALQYSIFEYFCTSETIDTIVRRIQDAIICRNPGVPKPISGRRSLPFLIGNSPEIVKVNEQARALAAEDKPVLLIGETGTGKEYVASEITKLSHRRNLPFVRYDCRTLLNFSLYEGLSVPDLIYTGMQSIRGKQESATLFLSHIEHLPSDQRQEIIARYARHPIRLLGSYERPVFSLMDEKIPSTVSTLRIPALRQHREDIPMITGYFISRSARKRGIRSKSITAETLRLMQEYSWPGNIRELSNIVDRMMAVEQSRVLNAGTWRLCQGHTMQLNVDGTNQLSTLIESALKGMENQWKHGSLYQEFMQRMQKMLIDLVLAKVDYNQAIAARILGISRNTLRQRLKSSAPKDRPSAHHKSM